MQGITSGNVTANVSSGNLISTSAAEAARPQPARMASPAGGGGGGSGGGGSGRVLPPMPTAVPQTEREKELAAKAELRRARRFSTAPRTQRIQDAFVPDFPVNFCLRRVRETVGGKHVWAVAGAPLSPPITPAGGAPHQVPRLCMPQDAVQSRVGQAVKEAEAGASRRAARAGEDTTSHTGHCCVHRQCAPQLRGCASVLVVKHATSPHLRIPWTEWLAGG